MKLLEITLIYMRFIDETRNLPDGESVYDLNIKPWELFFSWNKGRKFFSILFKQGTYQKAQTNLKMTLASDVPVVAMK